MFQIYKKTHYKQSIFTVPIYLLAHNKSISVSLIMDKTEVEYYTGRLIKHSHPSFLAIKNEKI